MSLKITWTRPNMLLLVSFYKRKSILNAQLWMKIIFKANIYLSCITHAANFRMMQA